MNVQLFFDELDLEPIQQPTSMAALVEGGQKNLFAQWVFKNSTITCAQEAGKEARLKLTVDLGEDRVTIDFIYTEALLCGLVQSLGSSDGVERIR